MQFVADHAYADAAVRLIQVAVIGAYVDDAGSTSAVAGRERALVECDFLHGLGLEDREDAQHVLGVVDRDAVQQKQVLIGTATPHIQAREPFRSALDSGKKLDGLQDIGLSEQRRSALDGRDGHFDGAHFGRCDPGLPRGGHDDFFQRGAGDQSHMDGRILPCGNGDGPGCIAHIGIGDIDLPGRLGECQGIEPEVVGNRSSLAGNHPGPDERFARSGVHDQAADGHFSDFLENHVVPFDLILDVPTLEKMRQRLFERRAFGLPRLSVERERRIVNEMDTVSFFQDGHPVPQVVLCPKACPNEEESHGHEESFYLFHALSV